MTKKSTSSSRVDQTQLPYNPSGYDISRFNALRYGILSRETVLPWEDADAYSELLTALVQEHQPAGPSELALVEELASVVWRKRRLRLAEASVCRTSLHERASQPADTASVSLILSKSEPENVSVETALKTSQLDDVRDRQDIASHQQDTMKAIKILEAGDDDSYSSALQLLPNDIRQSWENQLTWEQDDYLGGMEPYADDDVSLLRYLKGQISDWHESLHQEIDARPMVRTQIFGEAFDPTKLERLVRYETFLDRKFEKTLSTLIRLQQVRLQRS